MLIGNRLATNFRRSVKRAAPGRRWSKSARMSAVRSPSASQVSGSAMIGAGAAEADLASLDLMAPRAPRRRASMRGRRRVPRHRSGRRRRERQRSCRGQTQRLADRGQVRRVLLPFPGEHQRICDRRRGEGVNFRVAAASWHRLADADASRAKDDGGAARWRRSRHERFAGRIVRERPP